MRRSRAEVFSTETCMDIPRCTDVGRAFPTPESRACILVGQTQEVTLLKTGRKQAPNLGARQTVMSRPVCKYSRSSQGSAPTLLYIEALHQHHWRPAPRGDQRASRASSRNTIATNRPPTPRNGADNEHKTTENKNGAALFRYCAVFCYLNSHLYGADGETRTLTPCGAGT